MVGIGLFVPHIFIVHQWENCKSRYTFTEVTPKIKKIYIRILITVYRFFIQRSKIMHKLSKHLTRVDFADRAWFPDKEFITDNNMVMMVYANHALLSAISHVIICSEKHSWVQKVTCIIRPPGTVPDGLIFHRRCFLGSHISEVPRPIAAKLCHMIGIWLKRSRKFQKFGGLSPKKILGAKDMQNFGQFIATSDFDREYLQNGLRYPNHNSKCIYTDSSCFLGNRPVNFGPLISQI